METAVSRNCRIVDEMHDAFNRRDFEAATRHIADECIWTDHARGMTFKGPEDIRDHYLKGWTDAFSDGKVTDVRNCDGITTVVSLFVGRGTNDGPLGPLPATGREVILPYCEVYHFNAAGKVIAGECYWDQLGLLRQLGVAE